MIRNLGETRKSKHLWVCPSIGFSTMLYQLFLGLGKMPIGMFQTPGLIFTHAPILTPRSLIPPIGPKCLFGDNGQIYACLVWFCHSIEFCLLSTHHSKFIVVYYRNLWESLTCLTGTNLLSRPAGRRLVLFAKPWVKVFGAVTQTSTSQA